MSKKLFHIVRFNGVSLPESQADYLHLACDQHGITYEQVDVDKIGPIELLELNIAKTDGVYRSAQGVKARKIEQNIGLRCIYSIYTDLNILVTGKGNSRLVMEKAGLPVVRSTPYLPKSKKELSKAVEYLGGFPCVIKISGGYEGVGVIRVDSTEALFSVVDYVQKNEKNYSVMMQYIAHKTYARLVVVNEHVIAATADEAPVGDFRANARGLRNNAGDVHNPSNEVARLAAEGVRAMGLKCGGVDVMYADNGDFYFTEINSPFNFAETQQRTDIDIAHGLLGSIFS